MVPAASAAWRMVDPGLKKKEGGVTNGQRLFTCLFLKSLMDAVFFLKRKHIGRRLRKHTLRDGDLRNRESDEGKVSSEGC